MKKLISVLILSMFSSYSSVGHTQNLPGYPWTKSDLLSEGLIGPVKTVRTEEARILIEDGKSKESDAILVALKTYDIEGKIIESTAYVDGVIHEKTITTYDSNKKKVEVSVFDPDGSLKWKEVRSYGNNGFMAKEEYYGRGEILKERVTYTYDGIRQHTKRFKYDSEGNLLDKPPDDGESIMANFTCVYETQGRTEYRNWHNALGTLTRIEVYVCDGKGHVIEWSEYHADGSLEHTQIYKHDSNEKRIESASYGPGNRPGYKEIYTYDDIGNFSQKVLVNPDGSPVEKSDTIVDFENNRREYISYASDGSIRSRRLTTDQRDQMGNWVKRSTSFWGTMADKSSFESHKVVYRTISYY